MLTAGNAESAGMTVGWPGGQKSVQRSELWLLISDLR